MTTPQSLREWMRPREIAGAPPPGRGIYAAVMAWQDDPDESAQVVEVYINGRIYAWGLNAQVALVDVLCHAPLDLAP